MKAKILIAWGGSMIMAISIFNPGVAGPVVFFIGLVASVIFLVVPFVAMIVNPIVEKLLQTKLMNAFGGVGKAVFKFVFHVPTIKIGKRS